MLLPLALQVLLLNGSHDRETGCSLSHDGPMKASDMVKALASALKRGQVEDNEVSTYVTTLLVPRVGGQVEVDEEELRRLGVTDVRPVPSEAHEGRCMYKAEALVEALGDVLQCAAAHRLSRPSDGAQWAV